MMRLFACALLAFIVCGCSPLAALNALVPTDGQVRHAALAYGTHERQRLDVYVPRAPVTGALPVVVFFYGGAWQGGRRDDYPFLAEAFASRGFVVVIPDYRVYPEVRYPRFVEDGALAVAWTVENIARYRGDPRRMVLMGHSAGAHIAAMLAYNERFLDARARSGVKAMVGLAGAYDFVPDERVIEEILAGEGDSALAMPARFVRAGAPPTLLVTGDRDGRVNPANTEKLARRLREAGSTVDVRIYPGLSHAGALARLAAPFRKDELLDTIGDFVTRATGASSTR